MRLGMLLLWGLMLALPARAAESMIEKLRASFETKNQATLARLEQDETQQRCTRYASTDLPAEVATRIQSLNQSTLKPPADGQSLGDYTRGEAIAQRGTGFQSSDDPAKPAGGNCYACHQLSGAEIAYGNLGPSLYHYGTLRGTSTAALGAAWGKLYNSNATEPCSRMPRFGHRGILDEQQLKDLMALLFDPASPVNQ
jgi:sulfur-oxidizing protein SoxX